MNNQMSKILTQTGSWCVVRGAWSVWKKKKKKKKKKTVPAG